MRVFGQEIVYAGGVLSQSIAQVEAGMGRKPNKIERLGTTTKTEAEIQAFLRSVSGQWTASNYDLWTHNCNNFSECVVNFLCDKSIPKWILDFPTEILQTPLGQMLAPMLGTQQDALKGQLGTRGYVAPVAPSAVAPADAMSVTIKPATGNAAQRTLSLAKTATVGDLRAALSVDATPRFVFMGKLLTDDAKTLATQAVMINQDSPLGNGNNFFYANAGDAQGWKLFQYDFNGILEPSNIGAVCHAYTRAASSGVS